MNEASLTATGKILAFATVVEVGTGLGLIVDPGVVVALLMGVSTSGEGMSLGRFLGVALLALGLACWPSRQRGGSGSPRYRAMLTYNVLVALYLTYLGAIGYWRGRLLWPGVLLHGVVALLLVWTWRAERQTSATNK